MALIPDDRIAVAILAMFGRFCATYAINTGFQFSVEMMPTQLRGQGTALANVMAMVANIVSPYIVYSVSSIYCQ